VDELVSSGACVVPESAEAVTMVALPSLLVVTAVVVPDIDALPEAEFEVSLGIELALVSGIDVPLPESWPELPDSATPAVSKLQAASATAMNQTPRDTLGS
jgi:hypothetical protein